MEKDWHSVSLSKHELRIKLKEIRLSLSEDYMKKASREIALKIDHYLKGCVALYHPIKNETDIVKYAKNFNNNIIMLALPSFDGQEFVFREWNFNSELIINKWLIPEPNPKTSKIIVPDIIIVPMIGFDRMLHRIGYGYGYYDKILKKHEKALSIGIAFSVQEIKKIPVESNDIPLKLIITEREIITR